MARRVCIGGLGALCLLFRDSGVRESTRGVSDNVYTRLPFYLVHSTIPR